MSDWNDIYHNPKKPEKYVGPMRLYESTYVGDGVTVSFDGEFIKLTTVTSYNQEINIFFDRETFGNLMLIAKKYFGESPSADLDETEQLDYDVSG